MDPNTNTSPSQPATAPASPAPAAPGVNYSGFWRRFAAAFIDGVIISIVMALLKGVVPGLSTSATATSVNYDASGPAAWLQIALTIIYSVTLLHLWQATLGKKALGIKVTAEDGSKAPLGKLVVRELMKIVSAAILFIGYLMMLWSDKKQTLHDKVAGTVVVKG